ncbi:MAG: conjugal transfer protein TraN [Chlamydiae bacterium]|nr:conjugal transfer protein TraN [Chlamydiota bacterium]
MMRILFLGFFIIFTQLNYADSLKEARKEAREFSKDSMQNLEKSLLTESLGINPADFASDGSSVGSSEPKRENSELKDFLTPTKDREREQIDESEAFLIDAKNIIENPYESLESPSENHSLEHDFLEDSPSILMTCHEGGVYQTAFTKHLEVEVTNVNVTKQKKVCQGHKEKSEDYWRHKHALARQHAVQDGYDKDSSISHHDVSLDKDGLYHVVKRKYWHHDNIGHCNHSKQENYTAQEPQEKDIWKEDNPEVFKTFTNNTSCKVISIINSPSETRVIQGRAVTRNTWEQTFIFSCDSSGGSKCSELRSQGGTLVSKKCIQVSELGECDKWELTFDMTKQAILRKRADLQNHSIFGLNDEFETGYEKSDDFAPAVAAIAVFAELETELKKSKASVDGNLPLFNGQKFSCKRTLLDGAVYDCCKDMDGAAVKVKLAKCSEEEKKLCQHKKERKCRYVGTKKQLLNATTEQVYCCFPTQLARLFQEQGRSQLGMKWGSADHPKCEGIKLNDFTKLDTTKIDFSEIFKDFAVDREKMKKKLEGSIQNLKSQVENKVNQKSKPPIDPNNPATYEYEGVFK